MRFIWLACIFIQLVHANYGFEEWSNNDLKQFLEDNKVKQDPKWDNAKLIEVANIEAKKLENGYNKLKSELDKQLKPKKHNLEDYLSFSYLFGSSSEKKPILEWFFESWDFDSLTKFLKHHGIKVDEKANKSDLLKTLKNKYSSISKKNKGSNFYPGDWLYESWSEDDLKKWLNNYKIEFDKNSSKKGLVEKVKEYNYKATNDIIDTKDALFDSLDLFDKSIFDKTGQIRDEFFESWSYSQLREWLYLHGFINTKPDVWVGDLDKETLIKKAQTYKSYLLDDIQTWLKHSEKKSEPWLSKGESGKGGRGAKNLINDTFFVGIENWSKDKLREFLNVRKVPYSIFTTRKQLIDLVKEHRGDPIHVEADAYVVDNDISTNSIKEWLREQGQNVEGSRQDLIAAFQKQFKSHGSGKENIDSQIRLHKPDLESFKHYLTRNVVDAESIGEDKLKKAYIIVEEYFQKATEVARDELKHAEYSVEEALQEIQTESYEYAARFLEEINEDAEKFSNLVYDAKLASTQYAKSTIGSLIKDWKRIQQTLLGKKSKSSSSSSSSWFQRGQKEVNKGGQAVLDNANDQYQALAKKYDEYAQHGKDLYNEYLSSVDDSVDDLTKQAGKQYEDLAKDANYKYDQYKKLYNKQSDAVAEAAGKNYERAVEEANKQYDAYSKLVNDNLENLLGSAGKQYETAAAEASKKYDEYAAIAADAADNAKKEAGKQYELASAEAAKRYDEYKKLADKKYQGLSKLANKQFSEYSKSANKKANELSAEAAKQYEEAIKVANAKYDEYSKLANKKYDEWSKEASAKADDWYKEAGKQYEAAAKDALDKYAKYSSALGAWASEVGAKAKVKYDEYSDDLSKQAYELYQVASKEASKKYDEFYKLTGKKYDEYSEEALKALDKASKEAAKQYAAASKDAGKKYDEYSKLAGELAVEYGQKASELGKDAGEKIQTASKEAWKSTQDNYVKYTPVFQDWLKNLYRSVLYHLGIFNNKLYDAAEQAKDGLGDKWDSIVKTYSNADLKSYLRSFGYNYNWLSSLNRKELLTLAEAQNKLFNGYKSLKWERPISEVLEEKLGLKRHPEGIIQHVKSWLGLKW